MTPIPSTRPYPLDCTSLSELIHFLFPVLLAFVLITSQLIDEDFTYVFFGPYLSFLKFVSRAQGLGFSYCVLWSVPLFLRFTKVVLTVHWTIPPFVSPTCVLVLSSSVHRTVPPMFGFHHMYFDLSLTVHWTVPPWFWLSPSVSSMLNFRF